MRSLLKTAFKKQREESSKLRVATQFRDSLGDVGGIDGL